MSMSIPTVTGYSTFWGMQGRVDIQLDGVNDYAMLFARSSSERKLSRILAGLANRRLAVAMKALNGVAAGGALVATYTRVVAPTGLTQGDQFGGTRTTEVVGANTTTAAADQTYINTMIDAARGMAPAIASYPADLSGNGGGGKLTSYP